MSTLTGADQSRAVFDRESNWEGIDFPILFLLTEMLHDVTAHAEMQAITSGANMLGGKYLKDCTLYVTVEPCVMCAGAIGWAQISRVVYGACDEKRGYTRYAPNALHPKTTVTSGVLEEECKSLMQAFFQAKR